MNTKAVEKNTRIDTKIKGPVGKIYIEENGQGGLPVFFIHSFGGSTAHWKNQLQHLQTHTIAMDLRGHGNSDAPADNDYTIESMVKDVEAAVDSLHLDKFILVGHSMGGSAAIAYAGKHPGKVAGLLVTGTPGKTSSEQSKPIIASLQSEKYDTVMNEYMKKLLTNATPSTNEIEMAGMKKINKEASINIIKAVFAYDALADFKKYKGPGLIVDIAGMEEQPDSLHKTFPDVAYKKVSGTSHWIQLDKPDEFNKILDEFLETVAKEK